MKTDTAQLKNAEEPGAVDNRLSLNPDAFPVIKEWEDGEEYALTDLPAGTKLRQISPGEFEVVAPVESGAETDDEDVQPMKKVPGKPNSAVVAMADEEEA